MSHARWRRARTLGLVPFVVLALAACEVPGGTPPAAPAPVLTVTAPDAALGCGSAPAFPLSCTGTSTVTVKNTGNAPTAAGITFQPVTGATRDAGCAAVLEAGASCTSVLTHTDSFTAAGPFKHARTVSVSSGSVTGADGFDTVPQVAILDITLGQPKGISIPGAATGLPFATNVPVGCNRVGSTILGVYYDVCVWNFAAAVVKNVGNVPTTAPIVFTEEGFENTPPNCATGLAPGASCRLEATIPLSTLDPSLKGSVTAGPTAGAFDQTSPYTASGSLTATSAGAIGDTAPFSVGD